MVGVAVMGRPKRGAKRPAPPTEGRVTVINLKGTADQVEWLEDIHQKTHLPKATIVRLALGAWAEKHGHKAFPEGEG